jgi:hypothetical protein
MGHDADAVGAEETVREPQSELGADDYEESARRWQESSRDTGRDIEPVNA